MKRSALSRRKLLHVAATTSAVASTGCWGSFNLTGKVYDWNGHFDSKWASWGIFVVFVILPVYGTLLFVDAVVINTIEFYSGKNPIKRTGPGGAQNTGKSSWRLREHDDDPERLTIEYGAPEQARTMNVERLSYNEFRLTDADGRVVSQVEVTAGGGARLRDGEGRTVAELDRKDMRAFRRAIRDGQSPSETLWALLDEPSAAAMIALGRSYEAGPRRI